MNLVKYLLLAAILSSILGEFGHYPFGSSSNSVSLLDLLVGSTDLFFLIWMIISKTKVEIPKQFNFLMVFWLLAFVSLLYSLRIYPVFQVVLGSLYLWRFIIYSWILVVVFNLYKYQYITEQKLTDWLVNTGITVTLLGFTQLVILPNFNSTAFVLTDYGFDPHQGRLASTFLDPNFVGAYLVLTGGLIIHQLLNKKSKVIWWVLMLIDFVGLVLTYSRSAYLMLAGFGLTFLLIDWKNLTLKTKCITLTTVLLVTALTLVIFPRFSSRVLGGVLIDKSAAERVSSWQDGFSIFLNHPLFGVGFDNIRLAKENLNLFKFSSPDGGHSGAGVDSSLLFVLATTGVLGAFFYLSFWLSVLRKLIVRKNTLNYIVVSLLVGLMIESQFVNSLFFPSIMLFYFVIVGLGLGFEAD